MYPQKPNVGCRLMIDSTLLLPVPNAEEKKDIARRFYERFSSPGKTQCFLFGYNRYADEILRNFRISGVVDDYTAAQEIRSVPVLRSSDLPKDALVLSLSGGRPLTARNLLNSQGVENLDYFSFRKVAKEKLCPVHFNEGFEKDFSENYKKYEWVYDCLRDAESKATFQKLVNFRFQYDLSFLEGFCHREDRQYFEPFLGLQVENETFADVGAYDGYTSKMFIEHCPRYRYIHLFEPDPSNMALSRRNLADCRKVFFHGVGLAATSGTLRLTSNNSGSILSDKGEIETVIDRLDRIVGDDFSFIKMDTEGAELGVLEGAREVIKRCGPRLAVAAYHYMEGTAPFWQIPEKVFSIRQDYDLYVRHYTESIYETVMFFVPKGLQK